MLRLPLLAAALAVATACSTAVGTTTGLDAPAPATDARPVDTAPGTTAPPTTTTPVAAARPEATEADTRPARTELAPVTPPAQPIVAVWQEDGPDTQRAQEFLLSLGFWLAEPNGDYGQTTTQAVMAFQKYYGLTADGKLGPQTAEAMNSVTERPVGRSTGGTLVEVDKSKQLVFLVNDGVTAWVLNTSTGSEIPYREPDQNTPGEFIEDDSITRPGVFAVNRERPEGWWEGDLGEIYRPKYFDGGIALHGSYSIPPYPASHGCVRLSIQAMDWIWDHDLVPMGTTVWVHGEIPDRDA